MHVEAPLNSLLVLYIAGGGGGGYNMDSRMNERESGADVSSIHRYATLQRGGVGTTWTQEKMNQNQRQV